MWPALIYGLISGVLSYILATSIPELGLFYLPGVVFGLIVSIFFVKNSRVAVSAALVVFVLMSLAGYHLAVRTFLTLGDLSGSQHAIRNYIAIFLAGSAGASVLMFGCWVAFTKFTRSDFFKIALLGGVLGLSFMLPLESLSKSISIPNVRIELPYLVLYVTWQVGILLALWYLVRRRGLI